VPKIWDTIKKGVLAKVALTSPVAQLLVHTAIQWRTFATETLGIDTPFFNKLVFKKLGAGVGGNLRLAVSGGKQLLDIPTVIY
jgi:long-chain acyl-CoA synthetase